MAKRNKQPKTRSNRLYCSVFGCYNSSITHPGISFFKLPGDPERRVEWLELMSRRDLLRVPNFAAYRVCETHFDKDDIQQATQKKLIKRHATPLLRMPNPPMLSTFPEISMKEDKETQTEPGVSSSTQTEEFSGKSENCAQCRKRRKTLERKD